MIRHPTRTVSLGAILLLAAAASITSAQAADELITVAGPSGKLGGAWRPAADTTRAVAIIIPGSGPTDRDGNSPLGISAATYRLLAEALSANGIATVRIDKRGMFSSREAATDPNAVRLADYAADAAAWAAEAARRGASPCAWMIGHSEGTLVAMLAAAAPARNVCGVVLLAGPGRRLGDILRQQLRDNPANAPLLADAFGHIASLERGEPVPGDRIHPALAPLFAPAVQGFVMDLLARDPADLARRARGPMTILQGETDLQVTRADAMLLKAARPDAQLVLLKGVNHVLKLAPADRAGNIATYSNPSLPLAPGVAGEIAAFIQRN